MADVPDMRVVQPQVAEPGKKHEQRRCADP